LTGSRVTRRYAKALFEAAQASKQIDLIEKDLSQVREIIETSKDFSTLLLSPVIGSAEKRKIFRQVFEKNVQPLSLDFLKLLLDKGREKNLPDIIGYFFRLVDESRSILRGQLITAHPFSAAQLQSLKKHLDRITGKNVQLDQQVDSSLIGGFVVRMNDTVIDTSIKNQLVKMKEYMIATE
jgi:F-type H+-transporting ATPase subunit delta